MLNVISAYYYFINFRIAPSSMTENPSNPPASDSDYMPMAAACTKVESQNKSKVYDKGLIATLKWISI